MTAGLNRAFSAGVSLGAIFPGALPQDAGECCAFGAKRILAQSAVPT
jgi:hypothetical protein